LLELRDAFIEGFARIGVRFDPPESLDALESRFGRG
jgi:hypothetical protein